MEVYACRHIRDDALVDSIAISADAILRCAGADGGDAENSAGYFRLLSPDPLGNLAARLMVWSELGRADHRGDRACIHGDYLYDQCSHNFPLGIVAHTTSGADPWGAVLAGY